MTELDFKIMWSLHKKVYITIAVLLLLFLLSPLAFCRIDGERVFLLTTKLYTRIQSEEDAEQLQRLPLLQTLSVWGTLDTITFAEHTPFLKNLHIYTSEQTDNLSLLAECRQLQKISYHTSHEAAFLTDLTVFSENTALEDLDVYVIHADGLEYLTHLNSLSLYKIQETELPALSSLTELVSLSVMYSELTEIDIQQTQLTKLNLAYNANLQQCRISENCTNLEQIHMPDTPLPEEEILGFLNLSGLKELTVSEGILSEESIAQFEEKEISVHITEWQT